MVCLKNVSLVLARWPQSGLLDEGRKRMDLPWRMPCASIALKVDIAANAALVVAVAHLDLWLGVACLDTKEDFGRS